MGVTPIPLTYVILQKSGRELMIVINDKTKRIVGLGPGTLMGLMHKDGPNELAGFLAAGWEEIFRGERGAYYERIQAVRTMHRKKLSSKAEVHRKRTGLSVQEEEKD
jgi:hypothetical protein